MHGIVVRKRVIANEMWGFIMEDPYRFLDPQALKNC